MIHQYRKKPVVIEAMQFQRRNNGPVPYPEWFDDAVTRNDIITHNTGKWHDPTQPAYCEIITLEGIMRANEGDWIIRGVKGELYPCKPDIFAATYEDVAARELDVEAARRAFEQSGVTGRLWRKSEPGYGHEYGDSHTQMAWRAWQAARSAAQTTAPVSTEQAAGAPGVAYRLLDRGDIIQKGDEFLSEDGVTWAPTTAAIFINMPYSRGMLLPARRRAAPSPNNSPVGGED